MAVLSMSKQEFIPVARRDDRFCPFPRGDGGNSGWIGDESVLCQRGAGISGMHATPQSPFGIRRRGHSSSVPAPACG
jgi:hypothetical protein